VRIQPVTHLSSVLAAHQTYALFLFIFRLKDQAERAISDEIFGRRSERWPEETVDTKEAYFIRDIFDSELFSVFRNALVDHIVFFKVYSTRRPQRRQPFGAHGIYFSSNIPAYPLYRWIPRKDWGCTADPSGRSVGIHNAAYE
jgi:asparagine synthase (glutamine-hydrolysing)